jgi:hypothetical protein
MPGCAAGAHALIRATQGVHQGRVGGTPAVQRTWVQGGAGKRWSEVRCHLQPTHTHICSWPGHPDGGLAAQAWLLAASGTGQAPCGARQHDPQTCGQRT